MTLTLEDFNAGVDLMISCVTGFFDMLDSIGLVPGVTLYTVVVGAAFVSITFNAYHRLTSPAVPGVK